MGKSCCAIDCTNRFKKNSELSFFRLPKAKDKRTKWIRALRRDNWDPDTETWICGCHFVSGKKSDDPLHPDYVPSLFSFTSTTERDRAVNNLNIYERSREVSEKIHDWKEAKAVVHESCIRELFRMCQCCGKPITDTHVTYFGAQMRVSWDCLGGHSGTWTSSPEVRGTPEVNSLSAASVLFTGNTITEMSNSDGCVSSHSMSPQRHMHSSLTSAAPWRTDGCMAPIFTLEDKNTEAGCLSLPSPEQEERNSSLVQEEQELPQIKEEQEEELLQGPEEAAGSTLTLPEVKSEDGDDENRETEPLASTEHMKTQAYIKFWVPSSQPGSDDHH